MSKNIYSVIFQIIQTLFIHKLVAFDKNVKAYYSSFWVILLRAYNDKCKPLIKKKPLVNEIQSNKLETFEISKLLIRGKYVW